MRAVDHYIEAERLAGEAANADPEARRGDVALLLQFAQVHATLALAGATAATAAAAAAGYDPMDALDANVWGAVAGVQPAPAPDGAG